MAGVGDFSANVGGAVTPIQPPANPAPEGTAYASIQSVLEGNLQLDWTEKGAPPNPIIAEAWGVAGGGRTQCSWSSKSILLALWTDC